MKAFQQDLGAYPTNYVRAVLNECEIKEPPVCEHTILEYLEIPLVEFTDSQIEDYCKHFDNSHEIKSHLKSECAALLRYRDGTAKIRAYKYTYSSRKRLSIFHECTHFILPWHKKMNYFCTDSALSPGTRITLESEAYTGASEFIMPIELFCSDIQSLPTSVSSISLLSKRYQASMEATGIRYVGNHPGSCGFFIAEPVSVNTYERRVGINPCPEGNQLTMDFYDSQEFVEPLLKEPLKIKYFAHSERLRMFVKKGTPISKETPVYKSWLSGDFVQGKIHASLLGGKLNTTFNIECMPLGKTGKVFAFIWRPIHRNK